MTLNKNSRISFHESGVVKNIQSIVIHRCKFNIGTFKQYSKSVDIFNVYSVVKWRIPILSLKWKSNFCLLLPIEIVYELQIRPRSHVTGYDTYPGKLYAAILAFTLFLPYPHNLPFSIRRMFIRICKWRTNLSGEQFSRRRHV